MSVVAQSLRQAAQPRWLSIALWVLLLALPYGLPNHALLISEIAIMALFAMSLDLILGYTGIVSLGHAAFFGMGAYSAALFAKHIHPDPLLGLVAATGLTMLLGAVCSLGVLRGSDLSRLMVTLGVALILQELANKLDWLTGGADGLQGVVMGPLLGYFPFDLFGQIAAWYALVVTWLVFIGFHRLVHSPLGLSWQAIRDNPLRAQAIGIAVHARLVTVYTLAAAVAGMAGGLQAQATGFASLDVFGFDRSADVLLMLVIGGTGWLWGGVIGAVVFKTLHSVISAWTPQYWTFWLGLFLVLLMLVGREALIRPWTWGRRT
ncbi:MAG: branched-chain amino acid ABC transporter permease [Betaproteobacteria bacterium]|nr:branched-chain amino acid ABC transporter permease [Betaproteobacteria bacterium]